MQNILIGREYPAVLIEKVKTAEKSIKILIYSWIWYPNEQGYTIQKFNNEILRAARRGVNVSAFVNGDYICNILRAEKISVKRLTTKNTMHVKMVIIDDKFLFIGSHNLTKSAFDLNHEISVLLEDSASILRCNNFLNALTV